jgi:hypothetical protein
MVRKLVSILTFLSILLLSSTAEAQWQNGYVALRTNGNVFQSGDQLKVEIIALEQITDNFYSVVSYSYSETVEEKDEDGKVKHKQVTRTRKREPGPVIQSMGKHQSLVLDTAFHFGDASPTGLYSVKVDIFQAYTRQRLATLRTCLFFAAPSSGGSECSFYLRGLRRVNGDGFLSFDGNFRDGSGNYSVLLLRGEKVDLHITAGGYTNGDREFNLVSESLSGAAGQTYDILLVDKTRLVSTTLSRVTIPSAQ